MINYLYPIYFHKLTLKFLWITAGPKDLAGFTLHPVYGTNNKWHSDTVNPIIIAGLLEIWKVEAILFLISQSTLDLIPLKLTRFLSLEIILEVFKLMSTYKHSFDWCSESECNGYFWKSRGLSLMVPCHNKKTLKSYLTPNLDMDHLHQQKYVGSWHVSTIFLISQTYSFQPSKGSLLRWGKV